MIKGKVLFFISLCVVVHSRDLPKVSDAHDHHDETSPIESPIRLEKINEQFEKIVEEMKANVKADEGVDKIDDQVVMKWAMNKFNQFQEQATGVATEIVIDADKTKRELKKFANSMDCHSSPIGFMNCLMMKRFMLKNVLQNPELNTVLKSPLLNALVKQIAETNLEEEVKKWIGKINTSMPIINDNVSDTATADA